MPGLISMMSLRAGNPFTTKSRASSSVIITMITGFMRFFIVLLPVLMVLPAFDARWSSSSLQWRGQNEVKRGRSKLLVIGVIGDIHLRLGHSVCDGTRPSSGSQKSSLQGRVAVPLISDSRQCDTSEPLLTSALKHYSRLRLRDKHRPEFLLLLGDNVMHNVGLSLRKHTSCDDAAPGGRRCQPSAWTIALASLAIELKVTRLLCKHLHGHHAFPVVGNNDLPTDWLLPVYGRVRYWYHSLFLIWWRMISGCWTRRHDVHAPSASESVQAQRNSVSRTFQLGGFYTVELEDNVDIVALNTVLWCRKARHGNTAHWRAIAKYQLYWLRHCLQKSYSSGRKVIIVGHVTPGINEYGMQPTWYEEFTGAYISLMAGMYRHTVIGQFFGHFHRDSFRVFRKQAILGYPPMEYSSVLGPERISSIGTTAMFLSPSISPIYGNCPTYRIFEIDPALSTTDYVQYRYGPCPSRAANGRTQDTGTFVRDYQFTALYNISSSSGKVGSHPTTADHLYTLATQLQKQSPRSALWRQFCSRYYVEKSSAMDLCFTPAMHVTISCAFTSKTRSEYSQCILHRTLSKAAAAKAPKH
ncbi:sphingomyelinase phosphodiesterase D-like [Sycon ciliatum]|uniref:sphingomyelinase phosphodiesterase D-like n=1 Tax=Sycon ciliatum TaxID=27933 RepID=UPI0020A9A489|eukprot:scpid48321/ scgid11664/ Acid sphingomyelinase-like phosphodiesterase 3b